MISPSTGSDAPGDRGGDFLTNIIIPVAVVGMVGSLVYFLIDLRSVLAAGGEDMLRFVCFWFLIGTVGIELIRATRGSGAIAAPYVFGLAGAMFLFVYIFTTHFGGMAATSRAGLSLLANYFIVGVLWWASGWLTRECMQADTQEGPDSGILSAAPDNASHRRRPVGRSVIYFSLVSLALFGLGQRLLVAARPDIYRHAFWCIVINLFAALSLLAVTNLSSLGIYARLRRAELPPGIRPMWLSASALTVLVILVFAWALPRRDPQYRPEWMAEGSLRPYQGPSRSPDSAPFEGGRKTYRPSPNALQGQGAKDQAATQGRTREGSKAASRGQEIARGSAGGERPQGKTTPRPGDSDRPGPGGPSREAQDLTGRRLEERPGRQAEPDRGPPSQDSASPPDPSEGSEPQPSAAPETSRPLPYFASQTPVPGILRWLAIALLILAILYALARLLPALWERLKALKDWRPPGFLAVWAGRLRAWWQRLLGRLPRFGRASRAQARSEKPFDLRYDPFADPDRPAREIVADVYGTLMAFAAMTGYPRSEDQTPYEFLRKLPAPLHPLQDQAALMTRLYVQAAYTSRDIPEGALSSLREAWQVLRGHIGEYMSQRHGERIARMAAHES
ncbi:MAG: DUF4129 domain-containing protein [Armatimonadetes bacterium]|nr:DUF4129 domain-containing protein [Armatimonadota bacterium]